MPSGLKSSKNFISPSSPIYLGNKTLQKMIKKILKRYFFMVFSYFTCFNKRISEI